MAKIKYHKPFTVGELVEQLIEVIREHGADVPVGRIGHFGEVNHIDKHDVHVYTEARSKYEVPINHTIGSTHCRDVPKLVEIHMPDIGKEPD